MSIRSLHSLVGKAVLSESFRAGILNGRRAELLCDPALKLEADEVAEVMAIKASTLKDFAAAVEQLVEAREAALAKQSQTSDRFRGGDLALWGQAGVPLGLSSHP